MGTKRRVLQEQRLKHQLEIQSRQIEQVFTRHQMAAHVAGGTIQPRQVSFDLHAPLTASLERLRTLKDELVTALRATDVRLSKENGAWRLHVSRAEEPPVALFDLLPIVENIPAVTAVLGLAEDGSPVLLNFADQDVTHVLLSGTPGAGKTTLLRTIAASLALNNRQSHLQLLILATNPSILGPLNHLPHTLSPVICQPEDTTNTLHFLANEMNYRLEQQITTPTIVVLMDNADSLLEAGGKSFADIVIHLTQRGAKAGIHLILSVEKPDAATLTSLLRANLPLRLVGRMSDAQKAQLAAGISGSEAEHLLGQGDFLAIAGDNITHFQAAFISDYDLHMVLEDLQKHRPRTLLAQPFSMQTTLSSEEQSTVQQFTFDGENIEFDELENEE
jgi:S-DNA-T family DNA segregation ATPase FtsK/SpoIIIE